MAKDITIAISAKDHYSDAVNTMRRANQAFSSGVDDLGKKLVELDRIRPSLKIEVKAAKEKLEEMKKRIKEVKTSDEEKITIAADLSNAEDSYNNALRNLKLVESQTRKTERALNSLADANERAGDETRKTERAVNSLADANSRADNRVGGSGAGGIMGRLAGAGLGKMVGDSVSGAVNFGISSAFGDSVGSAISTTLSGAISGAAIGSIAGTPGAVIGGIVGLAAGGIQAKTQSLAKEDEAFKDVVQGRVETVLSGQDEKLMMGSALAASREQTRLAFHTSMGADIADDFLGDVRGMAASTPFSEDEITAAAQRLSNSYDTDEILDTLTILGDTRSAKGRSMQDMEAWIDSLNRMKMTDKITQDDMKIFTDRGVNIAPYLAKAYGKTVPEIYEGISDQKIKGAEAAEIILEFLGKTTSEGGYAGGMELQSHSFLGVKSTLDDTRAGIYADASKAANGIIQKDWEDEIALLEGEMGTRLTEAYSEIAIFKAELSTLQGKLERDALDAVMSGRPAGESFKTESNRNRIAELAEEYKKEGANKGMILAEAEAIAVAEYEASEGAQSMKNSKTALIENVRNDTAIQEEYWNTGYVMGQEYSEGIISAIRDTNPFTPGEALSPTSNNLTNPSMVITNPMMNPDGTARMVSPELMPGKAFGMAYVPRDDYLARLHEGERVLTAQEARAYGRGGAAATITGNNFTVREEADIYKIASAIAEELRRAQQVS